MFEPNQYRELCSELHVSEEKLEEVIQMTEQEKKRKFHRPMRLGLVAAAVAALLLLGGTGPGLFLGLAASSLLAGWCLWHTDGYAFYRPGEARLPRHRSSGRPSLGRYLVRYLLSHKNYLVNTGILWGMAWVLPLFFRQVAGVWMAPLGFALLSFNTPHGDPAVLRPQLPTGHPFSAGAETHLLPSLQPVPLRLPSGCGGVLSVQLAASNRRGLRPHAGCRRLLCLRKRHPGGAAGMVLSHPELESGE